ncbi:uncharacterized protein LOC143444054 [Arvicanthis niloticus]|uniref:uncharacterized protein LOC143444054 n=1 Tax=Arvicanthis niloticus TaxID=61156 RepID=UPI00403CD694
MLKVCRGQRTPCWTGSLPLQCRFWRWNSSCQAWWQEPLFAETLHYLLYSFLKIMPKIDVTQFKCQDFRGISSSTCAMQISLCKFHLHTMDWKVGSVVNTAYCSCRGFEFGSLHLQLFVIPASGAFYASDQLRQPHADTNIQTHKDIHIKKYIFQRFQSLSLSLPTKRVNMKTFDAILYITLLEQGLVCRNQ